ncbi:MAG: FkbM family methyltransferase [Actinomycetota bacterium]|nr:FkbM family methyltransferase [Actinomycetota bacterium]
MKSEHADSITGEPRVRRGAPSLTIVRASLAAILRATSSLGPAPTALAGKIARRLPEGIWARQPRVVARRLGIWFDLDLRDNVQRTLYFTGWYERRYLSALKKELRKGDLYVDVGAHIGIHALVLGRYLSRLGAGSVLAFEPASDVAARLRWAVARNGLHNVSVVEEALGAERGSATLKTDPHLYHESDGSVRSFYGPGPAAYEVAVTTLDDWLEANPATKIDVVKVDVEGAEFDVLRGMTKVLSKEPPRLVGVEIRDYLLLRAGVTRTSVQAFLQDRGYRLVRTPDLEGNFLFRRDDQYARQSKTGERQTVRAG